MATGAPPPAASKTADTALAGAIQPQQPNPQQANVKPPAQATARPAEEQKSKFSHGPILRVVVDHRDNFIGAPGTTFGSPSSDHAPLNSVGGETIQTTAGVDVGWNIDKPFYQKGPFSLHSSGDVAARLAGTFFNPMSNSGLTDGFSGFLGGLALSLKPLEARLSFARGNFAINVPLGVRGHGAFVVGGDQQGTNYPGSIQSEYYRINGYEAGFEILTPELTIFNFFTLGGHYGWSFGELPNAVQKGADPQRKPMGYKSEGGGVDVTAHAKWDELQKRVATPLPPPTVLPAHCTPTDKESVKQSILQLFAIRKRLTDAATAAIASGKPLKEVEAFLKAELETARAQYIQDRLKNRSDVRQFRDALLGNALIDLKKKPGVAKEADIPPQKMRDIGAKVQKYIEGIVITDKEINDAKDALPDIVITKISSKDTPDTFGSGEYKITIVKNDSGKVVDIGLPDAEKCTDLALRYQSSATAAASMQGPSPKESAPQQVVGDLAGALTTNQGLVLDFKDSEPGIAFKKPQGSYRKQLDKLEAANQETKVKGFKGKKSPADAAQLLKPFMEGDNTTSLATLIESLQLNYKPSFLSNVQWTNLKTLAPYIKLHVVGKADGRGSKSPYEPSDKNIQLSGDRATAVATAILQAGVPFDVVAENLTQAKQTKVGEGTLLDLVIASEKGGAKKGQRLQNRSVFIYPTLDQEAYQAALKAGKAKALVKTEEALIEKDAAPQSAAPTAQTAAPAPAAQTAAPAPAAQTAAAAPAAATDAPLRDKKLSRPRNAGTPAADLRDKLNNTTRRAR